MFKKSKRSFRQRTKHSDSEDDQPDGQKSVQNQDHNNEDSVFGSDNKTSGTRIVFGGGSFDPDSNSNDDGSNQSFKSSTAKSERKTKLSFEDDEEEDVFIVKKSLYSRRMEKNKQKLLKTKITSHHGPERLAQDHQESHTNHKEVGNEACTQSNSSIPTVPKEEETIFCPGSDEDEDLDFHEISSNKKGPEFRPTLQRGFIPDAKTIYELKKQRQKLARTVAEDFIPLNDDENDTTKNEGRLVRESDEDKSEDGDSPNDDDDENGGQNRDRIQFGNVDYQTKENEKFKERFRAAQEKKEQAHKSKKDHLDADIIELDADEDDSDDEDDENGADQSKEESEDEMDKWEREQIRKAVRLPNIPMFAKTEVNNKYLNDDNATLINKLQVIHDNHYVVPIEVDHQEPKDAFGSFIPPYITSDRSQNLKEFVLTTFADKIQSAKQKLESSIEENQQLYDRVEMDLKLALNDLESYDSDVSKLTDDYNFYRNFLDFVHNLCDCINDKLSVLENNEKQAMDVFKRLAQKNLQQNRTEIQDQNSISLHFIMNHKALCIQHEQNNSLNSILDLYDFQGDQQKHQLARMVEERNQRRFRSRPVNLDTEHLDEDMRLVIDQDVCEELNTIQSSMDEMFEDTDEDFASIKGILNRFELWKKDRLETYKESFVNEFLPKFLLYYLRQKLVLWSIFMDSNELPTKVNITEMESIQDLIVYVTSATFNQVDSDLIDSNVIPELVDKVILPKLSTMMEQDVWNPLSTRQTNRLATFLQLLSKNLPTLVDTSENLPLLLQKIVFRIERTLENDVFIPQMIPGDFFQPLARSNSNNQQRSNYETKVIGYVTQFFEHQYWQTFRFMTNVISMRNIIDERVIKELALNRICFRYILMSIQRSALDGETTVVRLQQLITHLPKEWLKFDPNIKDHFIKFIQSLIDTHSPSYPEKEQKSLYLLKQKLTAI